MSEQDVGADVSCVVEARGVRKSFGGVHALRGVDLAVRRGEVHGLLGENGSGKSTLIKVLAGYHVPDAGTFASGGRPLALPSGGAAVPGFEFVHQDLGLVDGLTVAENLMLRDAVQPTHQLFQSPRHLRARAQGVLARYELDLPTRADVAALSPLSRAMLAIVRAADGISRASAGERLLVLDEPTVFLPAREVERLFELVQRVVDDGAGVLFVSHDLEEVLAHTDRVTVLRDGQVAGWCQSGDASVATLTRMIIGRDAVPQPAAAPSPAATPPEATVVVRGLRTRRLKGLDLTVRPGEVLGVTGLIGSGVEELPFALFGAGSTTAGELQVGSTRMDLSKLDPATAVRHRVALVPGSRTSAACPSLSVAENINLMALGGFTRAGALRLPALRRHAAALMDAYDVRPRQAGLAYGSFSGGNQQKAVMAKWQQTEPRLFVLDEPTQGVDVGAREQIWDTIRSRRDVATICVSTDHEQLAALCDRVLVIRRGVVSTSLEGDLLTKEALTDACLGASTEGLRAASVARHTSAAPSSTPTTDL